MTDKNPEYGDVTASTSTSQPYNIDERKIGADVITQTQEGLAGSKEENERLGKVESATWFNSEASLFVGEKWRGFSNTWDDTWLARGVDYFQHDREFWQEEDKEFTANFKGDAVLEYANSVGLDFNDINSFDFAKNAEHRDSLVAGIKEKKRRETQMANALSSTERIVSSLATGIAGDIDTIIAPVASIGAKITGASKIMALGAGATHVTYGQFIAETQDDVSWGEATLFSLIGGAIDGAIVSRVNTEPLTNSLKGMPSNATVANVAEQEIAMLPRFSETGQMPTIITEYKPTHRVEPAKEVAFHEDIKKLDDIEFAVEYEKRMEFYEQAIQKASTPMEKTVAVEARAKLNEEVVNRQWVAKMDEAEFIAKRDELAKRDLETPSLQTKDNIARLDSIIREMKRVRVSKTLPKHGVKQTDEVLETQAKHISKVEKELSLARQSIKDQEMVTKSIDEGLEHTKQSIDEINKADKSGIEQETFDAYKHLHDNGTLSDEAFKMLEDAFNAGKPMTPPKIKMTPDGDNMKVTVGNKTFSTPKKVALGLIATGALAQADDGFNPSSDGWMILAGAIGLGLGVANAGRIWEMTKNGTAIARNAKLLDRTRDTRAELSDLAVKTRISITETLQPLLNGATEAGKKLVNDFYFNPIEGKKTVERVKNMTYESIIKPLQRESHENYREWLKESGTGAIEGKLSLFRNMSKRAEFNHEVTRLLKTGEKSEYESLNKAVETTRKSLDSVLKNMQDAGIKGIEKITELENYVPRMVKGGNIETLMRAMTPASREVFMKEFTKMFHKTTNPEATAEAYLETMGALNSMQKISSKEAISKIQETLRAKGLDVELADDLAEALGVGTKGYNRLKARIPMDETAFGKIELTVRDGDGFKTINVGINDVVENDIMNIMQTYANQSSGHIAFADLGYKSVDDAIAQVNDIESGFNPKAKETILNDIELLAGRPVVDYSDATNRFWRDVSNYAMAKAMIFSTLSLIQEAGATMAKMGTSGWSESFKKVSRGMINTHGRDSMLITRLQNLTGLGMHRYGASYGAYKTLDDTGNLAGGEGFGGVVSKVGEMSRDVVLHVLPFVKTSDALTEINLIDTAQVLAEFKAGTYTFKAHEKVTFGITPEFEKMLQKYEFKMNDKGKVMDIELDKWSRADRMEFATVVDLMMQKRIQQATFGGTGAYTRQTALGGIISNLLKYPMNAYSNHGSFLGRGIFAGDGQAMLQVAMWTGTGALLTSLRSEIKGKEYDETDMIMGGLLNHPFMGAYSAGLGLLDPAPMGLSSNIGDFLNLYNYK